MKSSICISIVAHHRQLLDVIIINICSIRSSVPKVNNSFLLTRQHTIYGNQEVLSNVSASMELLNFDRFFFVNNGFLTLKKRDKVCNWKLFSESLENMLKRKYLRINFNLKSFWFVKLESCEIKLNEVLLDKLREKESNARNFE